MNERKGCYFVFLPTSARQKALSEFDIMFIDLHLSQFS